MSWIRRYRIWTFVRSALWLVPLASMFVALAVTAILRQIDHTTGWTVLGFGLDGARALLAMLAASMLSLLVFVLSALLIAVQVASAQLTPRVIAATFLRDRVVKFTIALVVFTFMLSIGVLGRSEDSVLQLSTAICVLASLTSIAMFLVLVDYSLKSLRPVSLVARVAVEGFKVVEDVYPHLLGAEIDRRRSTRISAPGAPDRTIPHAGASAVLIAADFRGLSAAGVAAQGLIELVPRVGDFIAEGEPLFHLYAGAARLEDRRLRDALAFGQERTLEQDPMFAFRILVDIAAKALSPAINDPTTAVLAIDQIHPLLREIGKRHLDTEAILDETAAHGVIFRTPNWEDYVVVAVSEIRQYGAGSLQVVRRLRALLEDLMTGLPAIRRPPLEAQLRILGHAVARNFPDAEDREMASAADPQGLGHVG
ncbi:MAG: DUF2254 domain-containing protein [Candidatus Limnocylindria bacterium]